MIKERKLKGLSYICSANQFFVIPLKQLFKIVRHQKVKVLNSSLQRDWFAGMPYPLLFVLSYLVNIKANQL